MNSPLDSYEEIWLVDFEFQQTDGENPEPLCMVASELHSGRTLRFWREELNAMAECPFRLDEKALYVSYYATAEMACHSALGWRIPTQLLDLFAEFRRCTNGLELSNGKSLLGALAYYGLPALDSAQKDAFRELILSRQSWSDEERSAITNYCESDVRSLIVLLQKMIPEIDWCRFHLRGNYMASLSEVECRGIPIDVELKNALDDQRFAIRDRLIERVNAIFPLFENGVFKKDRLEEFVRLQNIAWPRHESGSLRCDDDTFKAMATLHGEPITLLREARSLLSKMRSNSLAIGRDGRSRCGLSAFRSATSRNQPSTSKFIFGQPAWVRSLIKPEDGMALAYIDWCQQEHGIASMLSGDKAMLAAYKSGDPYLEAAKQAGAVPADATKDSHPRERAQFKECTLAVLYGMGAGSLASRLNQPKSVAERLLRLHRETYPTFWMWSDAVVDHAMSVGEIETVFGWKLKITHKLQKEINTRSIRNFPMQANGAEMMRIATILATKAGVKICAPIHDAFLIEADEDDINASIWAMQDAMECASRQVLGELELRSDVKVIWSGERYEDPRGAAVWESIGDLISKDQVSVPATDLVLPQPPPQSNLSFDERGRL